MEELPSRRYRELICAVATFSHSILGYNKVVKWLFRKSEKNP